MPVTAGANKSDVSQRAQYAKGGVGRSYWDMRDRAALKCLGGTRVLDAGCGEGITLEKMILAHPDWNVEGIDVDPENISICKSLKLPVRPGNLYDLPFENDTFDSCLFMEVIEHLEQPDKALRELSRITKKSGKIVVVFPVDWAMFAARIICLRFKEATFDPGHLRQWTARSMSKAMDSAGIDAIKSISLPFPSPFALHKIVVGQKR